MINFAVYLQFFYGKEIIVLRIIEIDYDSLIYFVLAVGFLYCYGDAVADEEILLFIYLE